MTVGVNLMSNRNQNAKENIEVAVIGLGGGGLCTYIHAVIK